MPNTTHSPPIMICRIDNLRTEVLFKLTRVTLYITASYILCLDTFYYMYITLHHVTLQQLHHIASLYSALHHNYYVTLRYFILRYVTQKYSSITDHHQYSQLNDSDASPVQSCLLSVVW